MSTYVNEKVKKFKNLVKIFQTHHMISSILQPRKGEKPNTIKTQMVRHTRSYQVITQ